MAFFTDLAPELRLIIYDHLLQDAFASNKRVVYSFEDGQQTDVELMNMLSIFEGDDSDLDEDNVPVTAWTRDTMEYEQDRTVRITSLVDVLFRYGPDVRKRAVHHVNIDDLLAVASTCRLVRSEVLRIAWSNADISVYTPENGFKDDIQYIFGHCLSEETCKMILTLYIDVGKSDWSAACVSETARFITKRLPNLKVLTIAISHRYTTGGDEVLDTGLMALTSLPLTISIEIVAYVHAQVLAQRQLLNCAILGISSAATLAEIMEWEDAASYSDTLRVEMNSSLAQYARAVRRHNEECQEDGSLLEDTVGMRSSMAGHPIVASQVNLEKR
ncbi:hypothetical protein E4T39_06673 [Aureobasidium subglaciale]|nr:hypothetical protein E4T39_06673 [Aureobasidium subglaciale]